jgi:hypothetical protein
VLLTAKVTRGEAAYRLGIDLKRVSQAVERLREVSRRLEKGPPDF